jgi:hypothetical protein
MVVLLPAQTETENLMTLQNAFQNIPDIHSILKFNYKMKVDLSLPKFKVSVCSLILIFFYQLKLYARIV